MAVAPRDSRADLRIARPRGQLRVSATDDFAPGVRGFVQRWASACDGPGHHRGARALTKPNTLRYPIEKLTLSPRWRGALRLTGILGRDEIPLIGTLPPEYNGLIDGLYQSEQLPPCVGNCPANVDARGQSYFLAEDQSAEAYELVRDAQHHARAFSAGSATTRARPRARATTTTSRSPSARFTASPTSATRRSAKSA